jgi:hypothetical protein
MAMVTKQNEVSLMLSKEELRYLAEANFIDSSLLEKAERDSLHLRDRIQLKLSASEADKFGDLLTERLAKTGFDQEYKLTFEGQILETLIDKFQSK